MIIKKKEKSKVNSIDNICAQLISGKKQLGIIEATNSFKRKKLSKFNNFLMVFDYLVNENLEKIGYKNLKYKTYKGVVFRDTVTNISELEKDVDFYFHIKEYDERLIKKVLKNIHASRIIAPESIEDIYLKEDKSVKGYISNIYDSFKNIFSLWFGKQTNNNGIHYERVGSKRAYFSKIGTIGKSIIEQLFYINEEYGTKISDLLSPGFNFKKELYQVDDKKKSVVGIISDNIVSSISKKEIVSLLDNIRGISLEVYTQYLVDKYFPDDLTSLREYFQIPKVLKERVKIINGKQPEDVEGDIITPSYNYREGLENIKENEENIKIYINPNSFIS